MAGPSPSPYKTRSRGQRSKKAMSESDSIATPTTPTARRMSGNQPTYPLASLLWSARSSTSQWVVLPLILMAVGLFRWAAGLWGYSGTLVNSAHYSELCH